MLVPMIKAPWLTTEARVSRHIYCICDLILFHQDVVSQHRVITNHSQMKSNIDFISMLLIGIRYDEAYCLSVLLASTMCPKNNAHDIRTIVLHWSFVPLSFTNIFKVISLALAMGTFCICSSVSAPRWYGEIIQSSPSHAHMRQVIKPSLARIRACRLSAAKLLSKPMLAGCSMNHWGQSPVKLGTECSCRSRKCF